MPTESIKSGRLTLRYRNSIDQGFIGYIEELKGVMTQGETVKELISNAEDAIAAMYEANRVSNQELFKRIYGDLDTRG